MKNQEAFVYCWTDHKTNMLYIGCHKGQQDDEYICSSKWMLEEYNKRPEDFTRQIIAEGTQDDCLVLETSILKSVDAKHNPEYYNQHNGDGKFISKKGHTKKPWSQERREEWSKKMSGEGNPFFGKAHTGNAKGQMSEARKASKGKYKQKEETKRKRSLTMKGRPSPRKGIPLSEEDKKNKSIAAYKVWEKRKVIQNGKLKGTRK